MPPHNLPFRLVEDHTDGAPGTGWYVVYSDHCAPATSTEIILWHALQAALKQLDEVRPCSVVR